MRSSVPKSAEGCTKGQQNRVIALKKPSQMRTHQYVGLVLAPTRF